MVCAGRGGGQGETGIGETAHVDEVERLVGLGVVGGERLGRVGPR